MFSPVSTNEFDPKPPTDSANFYFDEEPDSLTGNQSYFHVLPRILLTTSTHLDSLATTLATQPLHPACHNILLHGIAARASGVGPLRVRSPPQSVVDRVWDCRVRNWSDVVEGPQAGEEDELIVVSPTYEECRIVVSEILGKEEEWLIASSQVGLAGEQGMKLDDERGITQVLSKEWSDVRKVEKCLRDTPLY